MGLWHELNKAKMYQLRSGLTISLKVNISKLSYLKLPFINQFFSEIEIQQQFWG